MGRYFGIGNKTKKQKVSSYWKGEPSCNYYDVMHQLHWEATDEIYSASYSDYYKFLHDPDSQLACKSSDPHLYYRGSDSKAPDTNSMELVNMEHFEDEDTSTLQNIPTMVNDMIPELVDEDQEDETQKLGFDVTLADKFNHVPIWYDNKCICCGFIYDPSKLTEYMNKYDGTFCMN